MKLPTHYPGAPIRLGSAVRRPEVARLVNSGMSPEEAKGRVTSRYTMDELKGLISNPNVTVKVKEPNK